jgi:hypothetical protein
VRENVLLLFSLRENTTLQISLTIFCPHSVRPPHVRIFMKSACFILSTLSLMSHDFLFIRLNHEEYMHACTLPNMSLEHYRQRETNIVGRNLFSHAIMCFTQFQILFEAKEEKGFEDYTVTLYVQKALKCTLIRFNSFLHRHN